MQWDASDRGGFTTGEAWLPMADDAAQVNVAAQRDDPRSLLILYRRLLALRRAEPALATRPLSPLRAPGDLLAWVRKDGDRRFLVVLNLGSEPATYAPPVLDISGELVLSTPLDREGERVRRGLELRGDEGLLVRLA